MIPAGGLALDGQQWVHPRYAFFLPVKVLSRVFRGKFVAGLKRAYRKKQLQFPGSLKALGGKRLSVHSCANCSARMTVSANEFLRRFTLHVLPKGFVRIRFFGFLAHRRRALLPHCQRLLNMQPLPRSSAPPTQPVAATWTCPLCGGPMILVERLTAQQIVTRSAGWRSFIDTS